MTRRPAGGEHGHVIRNVCIHVENEQPLLCDLYDLPTQADAGLVCTNVRMLDGKRPVFIDQTIARRSSSRTTSSGSSRSPSTRWPGTRPIPDGHRARVSRPPGSRTATPRPTRRTSCATTSRSCRSPSARRSPADDELELEIDEGFLQRIRDI